ncbi:MAG: flippase-like domain-containing protein, partial [Proteobacteria bacterium]|nr:flippase-like domain-containing protein [Pseudomonadota bacterium]
IGLGLNVGLFESLVLVPAVILLSTVPVSIGGWGLREGLMVVALGLAGVPADAALSVSILFGLAMIVAGLPGGVLWLMAGGRTS